MRFSFPSIRLLLVPAVASVVLLAQPAPAGNQSGPGWNQAKPKKKNANAAADGGSQPGSRKKSASQPNAPVHPGPEAPPVKPRKGDPLPPPARPVPQDEELLREAPLTGRLTEDALILMAIANDPELSRRRDEVLISRSKALGAGDWENPELRIGYAWDHDDRLREAFTESIEDRMNSSERYNSTERIQSLSPTVDPSVRESEIRRTSGLERGTRYRTIETKVTPGRYKDIEKTTVYETRRTSQSENQSRDRRVGGISGINIQDPQSSSQDETRRIVEESTRTIRHPDDYTRDDELSILLRFRLPNFWERRAKIEIAAAETARAESEYLIEEDKVILKVRELYEELTLLENSARSSAGRGAMYQKKQSEFEALKVAELADVTADIRRESGKNRLDQRKYRSGIASVREELAYFCGLNSPDRIQIPDRPVRRMVPVRELDVDYLADIAQLHRSDLLDLQSRHQLAKAELMGAKAMRIPSIAFIDAGWTTSQTTGRTGESEEWGIRAGITLPFFEWTGINKAHKEFEKATEVYSRQIENQQRLIRQEISQAIERIKATSSEMGTFESDFDQVRADSKKSLEELSYDEIKVKKLDFQLSELTSRYEEQRYEVWSDYHKAIMALEQAIGTRLEKVLTLR